MDFLHSSRVIYFTSFVVSEKNWLTISMQMNDARNLFIHKNVSVNIKFPSEERNLKLFHQKVALSLGILPSLVFENVIGEWRTLSAALKSHSNIGIRC